MRREEKTRPKSREVQQDDDLDFWRGATHSSSPKVEIRLEGVSLRRKKRVLARAHAYAQRGDEEAEA